MSARLSTWVWMVPAVAFLFVALLRFARDKDGSSTFLVLGLAWLAFGITMARRGRGPRTRPPAG